MTRFLAAIALLMCFVPVSAQEQPESKPNWTNRKLEPVDEGVKDPSFVEFRTRLQEAAEKKDAKFVLDALATDVSSEVGGELGIKTFQEVWHPERPNSDFWQELSDILPLGGTFSRTESGNLLFTAPYTSTSFPQDLVDWDMGAIIGQKVNVRKEPSSKSDAVASLSYDIVKIDWEKSATKETINGEERNWIHVDLGDGRQGYVFGKYVRAMTDIIAQFEQRHGQWLMISFLAPD